MADLTTTFAGGITVSESLLAGLGPACQLRRSGDARIRLPDGAGRVLEDARRAHRERLLAILPRSIWNGSRMMGLNNIELITDRPLDVNLREIYEVKKRYPNHAVIASLMVDRIARPGMRSYGAPEDAGADGLELNFGLSSRYERARHGECRRSGARICHSHHRLGQRGGSHAGGCL